MLDVVSGAFVESYFVDEKYIYACSSGEYRILPHTPHNIQFCNDQIHAQIEVFREFSSLWSILQEPTEPLVKLYNVGTCIESILHKNYLHNLCFLYDHLEDAHRIFGEHDALQIGKLLTYEPDDIYQMTKTLKRNLNHTQDKQGAR